MAKKRSKRPKKVAPPPQAGERTLPAAIPPTPTELARLKEKAELYDHHIVQYKKVQELRNASALEAEENLAALREFARSLLELEDDLERAVDAARIGRNFDAVLAGLPPIIEKFLKLLVSNGLTPIESTAIRYDSALHMLLDDPPAQDGVGFVVKTLLRRGWIWRGEVMRRAIVEIEPETPSKPIH